MLGLCNDPDLYPVLAVGNFMGCRGTGEGPLFCHKGRDPLTKFQFWSVTTKALGSRVGMCI